MDTEIYNKITEKYKNIVMKKKQIVTVFLTSSNRKKYIRDAIESILAQDYINFCLVILDNNSTDGTEKIIKSYNDERIFYISRESRQDDPNFVFAFNVCATKYMVVFHDDDIVERSYLSVMLPIMEKENVQILSSSANVIDESGQIIRKTWNNEGVYSGDEYFDSFIKKDMRINLWFPANMYQTNFYRNINDYFNLVSAGPATDQYLLFQTGRYGGTVKIISDCLLNYREHKSQGASLALGVMDMQLIKYVKEDNYYNERVKKNKRYFHKYLILAYKAFVINYSRHGNASIRKHLKIDKSFYSELGWKVRIICWIYNLSYIFFGITIVPCAFLLRFRRNHE